VNIALLDRLRRADGEFVPWTTLVEVWPEAVAELDDLVTFGFALERHPFRGVAYRGPAERLSPDQIEWNLGTRHIGRRIKVWSRVASTNDIAALEASNRANDGLTIFAEEQTAGRGRRGRNWSAPPRSSLLMSVLIFPPASIDDPAWLTALGAVAVADVVAELTGTDPRIKWPNDVRVERRKIAGILVERGHGAVIGIGLNVNASESDFPPDLADTATSLRRLAGRYFDRSEVARLLLRSLDRWYHAGLETGPASLDPPIRVRSEHLRRLVRVETRGGRVEGRLEGIEIGHGLILASADGNLIRIEARDVRTMQALD
jgi:BirA family biotin operon repressor/biotin-[acetyl-CoA-carboxylase] ligase